MSGRCRSARPARLLSSTDRHTTTNLVAPARLPSRIGSRRSVMSAFATATAAFTSCCAERGGVTARTKPAASTANWACNCATNRPSAGSRPSCAMTDGQRRGSTRSGRWTLSMTSSQPASSSGCSRSSISSRASRPRWSRGSPSAASTSWRFWKGSAMKWDSRRRSGRSGQRVCVARP